MKKFLIYSPFENIKLQYVCDFIFIEYFGLGYEITDNYDAFKAEHEQIRIEYGNSSSETGLCIRHSDYLSDFDLERDPEFNKELEFENGLSDFDLFAAIFFNLTRVEEYRDYERDVHGRFISDNSLLVKKDLIAYPLIDMWLDSFKQQIEKSYGLSFDSTPSYRFVSTIDIDHITAYKHKPWDIRFFALLKDLSLLNIQRIKDRFKQKDPYDIYEWLIDMHNERNINGRSFFLCGNRAEYDKTLSTDNFKFISTVKKMDEYFEIGIHPSYASNDKRALIEIERSRLQDILNREILASRQHYLRMKMPETYRNLIELGIRSDHSMGHYDNLGFRAGTGRDFIWFDLLDDRITDLRIYPFQVMDVSLRNYLQIGPEDAFEQIRIIIDRIKACNSCFCLLWHNSSFYNAEGWEGWDKLYIDILNYAKSGT